MHQVRDRSKIILGCAWVLAFGAYCPMLALSPIVHIVRQELHVSNEAMGILFSVPVGMLIAVAIPGGWLGDTIGARKAVALGAVVMAAGSLMRGFAETFNLLMAFTVFYGIGYSIMFPNLPKLMSIWFPPEKVGMATGCYATGITIGSTAALALTLPVVFPLFHTIQGTFFFWGLPAGIAAILWLALSTDPPAPVNSSGDAREAEGALGQGPALWKNKNLWILALLLFFNDVHFYAWSAWTPSLLTMKGAPPDLAAFIASSRCWASLPAMFLMPWASHKLGLRKPFMWGSALLLMVATWITLYMPYQWGWALMAVVGIATSGTFAMLLALPIEMLPRNAVGTASGAILSIGYIGGLVGPWLTGKVVDATGNFDRALIGLTVIAALWVVLGFLMPEAGRKR
jgi:MFS transporter, AAHS family, 3-hydroxyphenylpropionic acid transporter